MASAEININVLDLPEVVALIGQLRDLALQHCQGCADETNLREEEVEVAFAAAFEPRS